MAESLRGSFLVATRPLRDPNFFRTVVLILEHGDQGAMGLIVNRPSERLIRETLNQHFEVPESDDVLFVGGPVEPESLLLVHNVSELSNEQTCPVPGMYLGGTADAFAEVMHRASEQDPQLKYRIYSGYSGWSPGQLESELERNDWLTLVAQAEFVFADDPYQIWEQLVARYRASHSLKRGLEQQRPEWN